MKLIFVKVLILFAILTIHLQAQPGFYASYQNLETPYWNLLDPKGPPFFHHGLGAGVQYRIPFGDGSLAFLPGLGYSYFKQTTSVEGMNRANLFQLRGGLRVFPLEFLLDCDCPGMKKGVFAEGFVGWGRWDLVHNEADVQVADIANAPFAGLSAGILLPYGKHLSIAPVFRYTVYPSVTWQGLNALRTPDTDPFFREETFLRQVSFEIHLFWDER